MARVFNGSQFYLHTLCSFTNGINHFYISYLKFLIYSFVCFFSIQLFIPSFSCSVGKASFADAEREDCACAGKSITANRAVYQWVLPD